MLELNQLCALPDGFLSAAPQDLHLILPGPTLLHLPGRNKAPLFVTVLQHGNEATGLLAVQRVLRKFGRIELPRALSIFIANIGAARDNVRRLPEQDDYNRMWPGTRSAASDTTRLMQSVVDIMRERQVFASIDIHNNSGLNPHYACVCALDTPHLQLASLFARTVVYFRIPQGTQSAAMSTLCPSVSLECGKSGAAMGVEHAADFLGACLRLSEIPLHAVADSDVHLFRTIAQVHVPPSTEFAFDAGSGKMTFARELDRMNFREIPAGTVFAYCLDHLYPRLTVTDEQGADVTPSFFTREEGALVLRRHVMPAMLSRDAELVRQDCLCYFMERMPLPGQ
ncbi:MAG: succinylglutamate desuccinylase/aspartoacylase family protein [Rhodocyclales bacterium]|nr:succinylglutamate desuccinylase/aspartoacylase family protein [Rhodocyclales bacterium]